MGQSDLHFDLDMFRKNMLLWALSIPIGFFPILVDQIPKEISQTSLDWSRIFHDMVCDLDYLLAYLSVLYALYIQGEYAENPRPQVINCKRICSMITVVLSIVWLACSLRIDIEKSIYTGISYWFNICMTIITLLIGVCMNAFIAVRQDIEG